ncbi:thioredoxin domain-containing protein [Acidovorax sp. GBBC 3334]|uniref:DsbA family protein n=1 Tax=Acidovorax sp. GBBC 3334 TaxID=2940496 RepID=UPI0023029EDA|nr:thioredoxin domain-containing protein [Acidovorax sp. GBBC 3334]MDA8454280.1 thioredoxin domain-containing protein [Acidovorax sp. GBBC 3334]
MQGFFERLARCRTALTSREWPIVAAVVLLVAALALALWPKETQAPAARDAAVQPAPPLPLGPPWTHGRSDARFTITVYADLECPYCQTYIPQLVRWIDATPDVHLQWQHLPLTRHEPAASREARLAECAGETQGHAGFWQAVSWIYANTRADGRGVPADARYPGETPALQSCLDSPRPQAIVQQQAQQAQRDGIGGTPTLRLKERQTGRSVVLSGATSADALLSAIDLLASPAPLP